MTTFEDEDDVFLTIEQEIQIKERVNAGAAWLDAHIPDWLERVEVNILDMEKKCACVLGQLFAVEAEDYADRRECSAIYGFDFAVGRVLSAPEAVTLGFDFDPDDGEHFGFLTDVWRDVITRRRAVA